MWWMMRRERKGRFWSEATGILIQPCRPLALSCLVCLSKISWSHRVPRSYGTLSARGESQSHPEAHATRGRHVQLDEPSAGRPPLPRYRPSPSHVPSGRLRRIAEGRRCCWQRAGGSHGWQQAEFKTSLTAPISTRAARGGAVACPSATASSSDGGGQPLRPALQPSELSARAVPRLAWPVTTGSARAMWPRERTLRQAGRRGGGGGGQGQVRILAVPSPPPDRYLAGRPQQAGRRDGRASLHHHHHHLGK